MLRDVACPNSKNLPRETVLPKHPNTMSSTALNLSPDADLYALLKLGSKATGPEIKSAYRRLALQHHPDKQAPSLSSAEKEAATLAFQQIGFAYTVLGDENRRKRYDATGSVEESDLLDTARKDWSAYFKELWTGLVNAETIEEYSAKYRGEIYLHSYRKNRSRRIYFAN